jgi:hypothetical protein
VFALNEVGNEFRIRRREERIEQGQARNRFHEAKGLWQYGRWIVVPSKSTREPRSALIAKRGKSIGWRFIQCAEMQ